MYCSNSKITVRRGTEVTRLDGKHVFESTTLVDADGGPQQDFLGPGKGERRARGRATPPCAVWQQFSSPNQSCVRSVLISR
jgi:hypothetical protein